MTNTTYQEDSESPLYTLNSPGLGEARWSSLERGVTVGEVRFINGKLCYCYMVYNRWVLLFPRLRRQRCLWAPVKL